MHGVRLPAVEQHIYQALMSPRKVYRLAFPALLFFSLSHPQVFPSGYCPNSRPLCLGRSTPNVLQITRNPSSKVAASSKRRESLAGLASRALL